MLKILTSFFFCNKLERSCFYKQCSSLDHFCAQNKHLFVANYCSLGKRLCILYFPFGWDHSVRALLPYYTWCTHSTWLLWPWHMQKFKRSQAGCVVFNNIGPFILVACSVIPIIYLFSLARLCLFVPSNCQLVTCNRFFHLYSALQFVQMKWLWRISRKEAA